MSSYYLFQGSSPSTRMSGRTMCLGTDWPLAGISQNVSVLCNICVTYVMVGMQAEGRLSIVLCINVLHWMIMFRCGDALKELFFTPFLQHMIRGISMQELLGHKAIYQPGVARKVCVFLHVCTID